MTEWLFTCVICPVTLLVKCHNIGRGANTRLILFCFCVSCKLNLFDIFDFLLAKSMERWQDSLAIAILTLVVLLPPRWCLGNIWPLDRFLKWLATCCKFCQLPTKMLKNMLLQIKNSSVTFKKEPTIDLGIEATKLNNRKDGCQCVSGSFIGKVTLHISFAAWFLFHTQEVCARFFSIRTLAVCVSSSCSPTCSHQTITYILTTCLNPFHPAVLRESSSELLSV